MQGDVPGWRRYLRLWRREAARDVEDEVEFHLAMRVRDLKQDGLPDDAAALEARRQFGDVDAVRDQLHRLDLRRERRMRRAAVLEELHADVSIAFRMLARRPAFALAAVGTLTLGIGATTAMFSLVEGILLRPLPYPEPDRLAVIWERNIPRARGENVVSMEQFEAWQERSRSFTAMAALMPDRATLAGDVPERVYGGAATGDWFEVVGVAPALGRGFSEADVTTGSRVVILSDGLWRERFGADTSVVGGTLLFADGPYTIIGVMPPGFEPPAFGWLSREQRYWVPFGPTPGNRAWGRAFLVLGRLRTGVPTQQADRELKAITRELHLDHPQDEEWTADVVDLKTQITGNVRAALWTLMAAVGLLLALASVNAANLVLARAQGRAGEFSLRAALGAGRGRLVRQMLAEAMALATLGAPLGMLLAYWGVNGLRAVFPESLPRASSVGLNFQVLGFALAISVGATLLVGMLPALRMSRPRMETGLRTNTGRVTAPAGAGTLVIVEIALALLLAVGAMLAVRSFARLTGQSLGFEAEGIMVTRLTLGGERSASPEVRLTFMTELLERLEAAHGTQAVSLTTGRPLRAGGTATRISRSSESDPARALIADVRAISPAYFSTLRIPVRTGRSFDDDLRSDAPLQAVIDRKLSSALWPGQDAVGKSVAIVLNDGLTAEVVGVVDDVRMMGARSEGRSTLYLSHRQWVPEEFDVLIRSTHGAEVVLPSVRQAVRALNPALPLQGTTMLTDDISESVAQDRATMLLLSGFSLVALLLASAGVYGLLAIEVGHRRREIGVRMALGASTRGLALSIVRRALRLALVGAAAGVAAGLVLTRYMAALLYGIEATDPLTFIFTAATLVGVAVVASGLPAWRATRVDPLEAVRVD